MKEKKSGYVFNARLPDIFTPEGIVFEFFNAKQGLKCLDAKQANGNSCDDYQVSYLCGGSGVDTLHWADKKSTSIFKTDFIHHFVRRINIKIFSVIFIRAL